MKDDLSHLKDIASDTLKNKALDRLRAKLTERAQDIKDAPESQMMDFYCGTCSKDFGAMGFKQIRLPKKSLWFAWYEAQCPEGHTALRYITDKLTDPYFHLSPFVKAQQAEFEDAMLSPDHPRFKVLYPEAYDKIKQQELGRELTKPLRELYD